MRKYANQRGRRGLPLTVATLSLAAASCIPAGNSAHVATTVVASQPADAAPLPRYAAAMPFFASASGRDELRALGCLTAAIYYEAATESEDGQRAVAQVVLNRVRHAGYPASVCGVVYQGPMRGVAADPGGGCQFSFTCDGSLLRTPAAAGWTRARRIAADALSGRVYVPIGLATHYHADYVRPAWAPALARVAAIGAHIFYRLPGTGLAQAYSGREPLPIPAKIRIAPPVASPVIAASAPIAVAPPPAQIAELPQSEVREQYRNSGKPLASPLS